MSISPEDLRISIARKLKSLPPASSNRCIYRVPNNLRKINEGAYRPTTVSIGPFYYSSDDPGLGAMQEQKLRYLQSFLQRSNSYSLNHYIEVIEAWEQAARQTYAETVKLWSQNFIEMLLIDAAFIIELFLRSYFNEFIDENDYIFNKPRLIVEVTRDLRLEENQLPFFILKGLYDQAIGSSSQHSVPSFMSLTNNFLTGRKEEVPERIATVDVKHLVDFMRLCYLPSSLREPQAIGTQRFESSPSVTELSEAGVKFVERKSEDLLDIRFSLAKGLLQIPRIVITDDTESLFRNIMVFEQCHYYFDSYIMDYFAFLDGLINTSKDVEILVRSGVIENWLGSNEEVAILFNNIFKQTRLRGTNFNYFSVCRELNVYATAPWHRWKAILKHDYFGHPWASISVIYAIVILVLTVLQVVTSFK